MPQTPQMHKTEIHSVSKTFQLVNKKWIFLDWNLHEEDIYFQTEAHSVKTFQTEAHLVKETFQTEAHLVNNISDWIYLFIVVLLFSCKSFLCVFFVSEFTEPAV